MSMNVTRATSFEDAMPIIISILRDTARDEGCAEAHYTQISRNAGTGGMTIGATCGARVERFEIEPRYEAITVEVATAIADKIASKFHPWHYFERTSRRPVPATNEGGKD